MRPDGNDIIRYPGVAATLNQNVGLSVDDGIAPVTAVIIGVPGLDRERCQVLAVKSDVTS